MKSIATCIQQSVKILPKTLQNNFRNRRRTWVWNKKVKHQVLEPKWWPKWSKKTSQNDAKKKVEKRTSRMAPGRSGGIRCGGFAIFAKFEDFAKYDRSLLDSKRFAPCYRKVRRIVIACAKPPHLICFMQFDERSYMELFSRRLPQHLRSISKDLRNFAQFDERN